MLRLFFAVGAEENNRCQNEEDEGCHNIKGDFIWREKGCTAGANHGGWRWRRDGSGCRRGCGRGRRREGGAGRHARAGSAVANRRRRLRGDVGVDEGDDADGEEKASAEPKREAHEQRPPAGGKLALGGCWRRRPSEWSARRRHGLISPCQDKTAGCFWAVILRGARQWWNMAAALCDTLEILSQRAACLQSVVGWRL